MAKVSFFKRWRWIKKHNGEPPMFDDIVLDKEQITFLMEVYVYLFQSQFNNQEFKQKMALSYDSLDALKDKMNYLRLLDYVIWLLLHISNDDWLLQRYKNDPQCVQKLLKDIYFYPENIMHYSFYLNKDQWPEFVHLFFQTMPIINYTNLTKVRTWLITHKNKFLVWPLEHGMNPWTIIESAKNENLDFNDDENEVRQTSKNVPRRL